jgi:hypothetical protein
LKTSLSTHLASEDGSRNFLQNVDNTVYYLSIKTPGINHTIKPSHDAGKELKFHSLLNLSLDEECTLAACSGPLHRPTENKIPDIPSHGLPLS